MKLSREQTQTRFLAIILPALTLSTHLLLSLSFALPGNDKTWAFWSLTYNGLAAWASVLGLIGALRLWPKLVSAYTLVHATTLSFVTLALLNTLLPFDLRYMNPVIPSWRIDETAICRDIDAGFGWDEDWLMQCSKNFDMVQMGAACGNSVLVIAQWWALFTVKGWSTELQNRGPSRSDIEKASFLAENDSYVLGEKRGY
ncbi:uncharacterized protein M421DRAFT_421835 [Didymella exigua CBS 183.55]|uniref:MARVEL domain-containing protein n=1 Tax=Didymella exigua CBS 183.55 TaxID=1150837 RepID=A0A6A5RM42_9PLEO|nr:uncharacterized protein M421DRAFT_421835 [Didymella exigua CBS 183.55]KAF1927426.1 hypothetical protein M421DRAFT_421835 [Didymella exigua CBS 183.55]